MQYFEVHEGAAKSFMHILRDMLENGLHPEELENNHSPNYMRKDIVQALLSRSFGDMTMTEQSQQTKLVNLLEGIENDDYLCHPAVLLGSTCSLGTAMLDAYSTLGPTD